MLADRPETLHPRDVIEKDLHVTSLGEPRKTSEYKFSFRNIEWKMTRCL